MVGVPHCMVGGYVETGAERSGANEPVRSLHDALKPKLHYAYDRYAGRIPTYAYVERNPQASSLR